MVARGVWWWLMGGSVGFIVFRGGWCWFLVSINGGFLMVNDSFGGGGDACGGYAFCEFSSMSLLLMGFSNTYEGILHVLNCALTALNCRREALHEFLVGLMLFWRGFATVWHKICFRYCPGV